MYKNHNNRQKEFIIRSKKRSNKRFYKGINIRISKSSNGFKREGSIRSLTIDRS